MQKGFSPVIATSILLVVSVVSIMSFQNWFSSYSTDIFSNVEISKKSLGNGIEIIDVVGRNLYIKNNNDYDFAIKEMKIDDLNCDTVDAFSDPIIINKSIITKVSLSNCFFNLSSKEREIIILSGKLEYNFSTVIIDKEINYQRFKFYQDKDYSYPKVCLNVNKGDANCDGNVDFWDIVKIKNNFMFGEPYYKEADCNDFGGISMADTLCVKSIIYNP